jgi:hypothetical protein
MTKQEHLLMIAMFTEQAMAIQALVKILRSHNLIENDDFHAYHELSQDEEIRSESLRTFSQMANLYQMLAKAHGLTVELAKP